MYYPSIDMRYPVASGDAHLVMPGEDPGDRSGFSAASAGDVNGDGFDDLIIGACRADGAGNAEDSAGAAYVVFGKAAGFPPAFDLALVAQGQGGFVIHGADAGDFAGYAVASAGDVNGDGFDDMLIGARFADGPGDARDGAGAAYVVFGKAEGFGAAVDLALVAEGQGGFVIHGEDPGDDAGFAVASAGDLNGDGFDDLIIGAPRADGAGNAREDSGATYVVFGKAAGFDPAIDLGAVAQGQGGFVIHGEDPGDTTHIDGYGWHRPMTSVASAGDLNGDGLDDLVIGAPYADGAGNAQAESGAAYVVYGKATGFDPEIDLRVVAQGQGGFVIHGEDPNDEAGFSVSSAGDFNGDGFDDLIIGAPLSDPNSNTAFGYGFGSSYLVYGKAEGFGAAIDLVDVGQGQGGFAIHGGWLDDQAGYSVASAGDLNGDGFSDLVIGTQYTQTTTVVFGTADVLGPALDLDRVPSLGRGFNIIHQERYDSFGECAASAGDVNGDGFDDLIVGASRADGPNNTRPESGTTYLIFGGGFLPGPAFTEGDDSLLGGAAQEYLQGGGGNDSLRGGAAADTLAGGGGNDVLFSNGNGEVLSGGAQGDLFVFQSGFVLGSSARILDFDRAEGDRIHLRRIDADRATEEDEAFTVIGTASFSGTAGELRWQDLGRGVQRIEGDVDGDGQGDGAILLIDAAPIEAGWFVL